MKKLSVLLALVGVLGMSAAAYADCIYSGHRYPTGTRLGNLTCQADGNWR
ncbi:MAG: hypothetical protein ABI612_06635 [Betaproteobacteria bacterium]